MRYIQAINQTLHSSMEADPRVYVIGEDLLDPYGGAFKATQGLSTRWPDRVLTTPISEAAIIGISGGMAVAGLIPVAEIMFGDFLTLCFDQLVNQISKFESMYNGKVTCPIVIRTPMGGGRGYGPTHSQCLEKFILGIPNIKVIAPSHGHDVQEILDWCIFKEPRPLVFIEHKSLYPLELLPVDSGKVDNFVTKIHGYPYPTIIFSIPNSDKPDITLVTYGGTLPNALLVSWNLFMEEEIICEIVVPCDLSGFVIEPIAESVLRTGRVAILEEGTLTAGWGAEVVARIQEEIWSFLKGPVIRIGSPDDCIPSSKFMETQFIPSATTIFNRIMTALRNTLCT
jgi:pyruvate/2-oxoglutarate/acetoin dehydrogenase E1 component